MKFSCVTLMIIIGITDSRADQFDVVGPVDSLFIVSGEDVILPCSLKPNISAVNMRVEWFRLDHEDSVVHLYEDHEDKNINQLQSYRGRTELFKDELQKGNTSLKLSRVQISDEGSYKCYIQNKTLYDDITVDLKVEVVGSPPFITIDGFDGSGGLHLQCESRGWNPEPELVWLDSEGETLTSETTDIQRYPDGFSVKNMITVYNSNSKYHCRVKLNHHMMETEIIPSSKIFNTIRSSVILISIGSVLIVIFGLLISVFIYRYRELQRKIEDKEERIKTERSVFSYMEKMTVESFKSLFRKYSVNVKLDPDSAHPDLIVSDDGKQVRYEQQTRTEKNEDQMSDNEFDKEFCVLGNEGFSSGCFYYEVEVKELTRWFVGVAKESAKRTCWVDLNPLYGYWVIGSRDGQCFASEYPYDPLLRVNPERIGVFVDYDEGRVSFYDVKSMYHIYTFTDLSFNNEKLFPVFYIWFVNSESLIICDLS